VRFEPGDSDRFFGRDKLTADLLYLLRRQRFAAVFGPSERTAMPVIRVRTFMTLPHIWFQFGFVPLR